MHKYVCILFVAYVFNLVIFKYTLHQAELMYFYFSAVRWLFSSLYFCCSVIALNDNQAHKIHLDFNIKKINCMKDKVLMKFYCIAASYFLYCRYIFYFITFLGHWCFSNSIVCKLGIVCKTFVNKVTEIVNK